MASSGTYKDRTFNLAAQGHRQPGLGVQDDGADHGDPQGRRPEHAPSTTRSRSSSTCPGYGHLGGQDLRRHLRRHDDPHAGDARLRQHRLRAARSSTSGPKAVAETAKLMGITTKLDAYPAEGLGGLRLGVSPLEMAQRLRDARLGRHPQQAEGDHARSCSPTASRTTSASPSASARSPTAWPTRSRRSSSRTCRRGTGTRREHRLPGRRQDGHHRQLQRRLVRRLHAEARDAPSGSATRTRCVQMTSVHGIAVAGRHLPGADLARLHERGPRRPTASPSPSPPSRPSSRPSSASTRPPARAPAPEAATTPARRRTRAPTKTPNEHRPQELRPAALRLTPAGRARREAAGRAHARPGRRGQPGQRAARRHPGSSG